MSNGNVFERLWKLSATAYKLVMDGKRSPEELCDLLQRFIENQQKNTTRLRHLLSVTLAPTSGTVTIASDTDLFSSLLDSDFEEWGTNQAGEDTEVTKVDVFEVTKKGTFKQLFGSLGRDLYSLCLSQGQIMEFCRTHPEHLQQNGYDTFFLFAVKRENEEKYDLFVARVYEHGGQLVPTVSDPEDGGIWFADVRYRLVVKQQTN